jgi:hypothetical protein
MINSMIVFFVEISACSLLVGTGGSTGAVELPEELESSAGAVELLLAEEFAASFAAINAAFLSMACLTLKLTIS